jgi:sugar (pentulose or hexulose) kinase
MKLSIDLGSTEFKAAVFADSNSLLASGACPLEYLKDRGEGKFEIAPETVVKTVESAISDAVEKAGVARDDITAVGVDSQAQTFAVADESLTPTTNFISWLDQRAADARSEMAGNPLFADFAEHSSISRLSAPMTICLLKHLASTSPELFAKNPRIIPLPSYVLSLLTREFATDDNLAAMSGLFSLRDHEYREEYLRHIHPDISQANFPRVLRMGDEVGATVEENPFGLPPAIPAHSCGNDQTAGAVGADLTPGDILITLGTAQVAYACLNTMPEPADNLFRGWYPGALFYAMFAENGGALISASIKQNPEFGDYARFAELAADAPGGSNVKCEPDQLRNAVKWSNENASPAEKARAVFEFLTDRMAAMVAALERIAGEPNKILVTGGGTRRAIWVDMLAEKIGRTLEKVNTSPENGVAKLI